MARVRGPVVCGSTNGFVCDGCGREVSAGVVDGLWLGRVWGKPIHACSRECFDAVVESAETPSHEFFRGDADGKEG